MKRLLCTLISLFIINHLIGQEEIDTTIKLDLLKSPASPASNLLGIATTDIEKPTDVSAFMLSLQSATSSFNKLPSNYAIDIAPYWLLRKNLDYTTEGLKNSSGKGVFKQTLVLSTAIRTPDSAENKLNENSVYTAFGFKFSILRGEYDDSTKKALTEIKRIQDIKLRHLDEILTNYKANIDPEVVKLRQRREDLFKGIDVNNPTNEEKNKIKQILSSSEFKGIEDTLSVKLKRFADLESTEIMKELDEKIQRIASSFQTARVGLTWDVAGGISAEFPNKQFNRSKVNNAGIWTTVGYTFKRTGAVLGLIRYLYNPDKVFAKDNLANDISDISTLDAGLRYILSSPQSKFSCSLEGIYRSILSSNTIDPSWRVILNADYSIWQNQKLTFSLGKNFDGTITKDGNLIAALTFLTGFGNKR